MDDGVMVRVYRVHCFVWYCFVFWKHGKFVWRTILETVLEKIFWNNLSRNTNMVCFCFCFCFLFLCFQKTQRTCLIDCFQIKNCYWEKNPFLRKYHKDVFRFLKLFPPKNRYDAKRMSDSIFKNKSVF